MTVLDAALEKVRKARCPPIRIVLFKNERGQYLAASRLTVGHNVFTCPVCFTSRTPPFEWFEKNAVVSSKDYVLSSFGSNLVVECSGFDRTESPGMNAGDLSFLEEFVLEAIVFERGTG